MSSGLVSYNKFTIYGNDGRSRDEDGDHEHVEEEDGVGDDGIRVNMSSLSIKRLERELEECREQMKEGRYRLQLSSGGSEEEESMGRVMMRHHRHPKDHDEINRSRSSSSVGAGANFCSNGSVGESESSGVTVITRPKGGRRSLYMGLEEVKACRELGFELEHPPAPFSLSPNSTISHWRVSSPGDDPRDVKARLKIWAQAVALVSASTYH